MPLNDTFWALLVALGLGLLAGLQKERAGPLLAGLRTFALITVFGAVTAVVAGTTGPWIVIAGLVCVTALMITGNAMVASRGEADPGQTTEVAVVLMFLVGAMCVIGPLELAIVLGGVVSVLLHLKEELRGLVAKLSDKDVRAVMQFVVISLIILPVLPNETYGPFDVLNPRNIWFMVVLIVGLNLAGYAAFRLFGSRAGTALAGVLGGIISSTATTVSYARSTKNEPGRAGTAAVVVWIASAVVFVRILVEVGLTSLDFLPTVAGPMGVMLALFLVAAAVIWRSATAPSDSPMDPGNPTELKPAIAFAVLYAVILMVVAAADEYLGGAGLYGAAFISGLTDIDAITLSTSNLVADARLEPETGWRIILVAALSNMMFKLGVVATLGSREMLRRLGGLVGLAVAAGVAILVFWG
jgi:uncharacterized membrane protein (DUF4010 family)